MRMTDDFEAWDEQIARDSDAGRLDALLAEARAEYVADRCVEITETAEPS